MNLKQIDVTGCRLEGAITKELSHAGPKHHAIILGEHEDGHVYIAESMDYGYQVSTYQDFHNRYSPNGEIIVSSNSGKFENITVAKRAIEEIKQGGKGIYNLITNNCECFVNRAMKDKSYSNQVINTGLGILAFIGLVYVVKQAK
ncbi:hypothetical protein SG34_027810 [Thalassomonas viridans]|uniref:LRAT domain-containing protein n=1 Tax=Thalassomonas viridans TaxID=137584 RepID=A0AAE9Z2I8_9GAMM|nr:hypothetical protein [Thalassomonas viridans]WDE05062.1 hypothetical protein SG34_027810 [Thalassomonas viridans]